MTGFGINQVRNCSSLYKQNTITKLFKLLTLLETSFLLTDPKTLTKHTSTLQCDLSFPNRK